MNLPSMSIEQLNETGQEEADRMRKENSPNPFVRATLSGGDEIFAALDKLRKKAFTIKPLLPEMARNILIYGPPGGGKSFIALDMGLHISMKRIYHGHKVKQKNVLYVAAEGADGVLIRVKAWLTYYDLDMDALNNFHILSRPITLDNKQTYAQAFEAIKELEPKPEVIFIDTLARSMEGDENSTRDMNKYVSACDELSRNMDGAQILTVHHTGKNKERGPRGAIALPGATDCMFELSYDATKHEITMNCERQKDYEKSRPMVFRAEIVNTGVFNSDGDEYTSLVPVYDPEITDKAKADEKSDAMAKRKVKGLSQSSTTALKAFEEVLPDKGEPPSEEVKNYMARRVAVLPDTKVLYGKYWDEHMLKIGISSAEKEKSRQTAGRRAKEDLLDKKKVDTYDGYYWRIP